MHKTILLQSVGIWEKPERIPFSNWRKESFLQFILKKAQERSPWKNLRLYRNGGKDNSIFLFKNKYASKFLSITIKINFRNLSEKSEFTFEICQGLASFNELFYEHCVDEITEISLISIKVIIFKRNSTFKLELIIELTYILVINVFAFC